MQIMQRMNKKMDIGWKLTNSNCDTCNGITMTDPNNLSQYYCPKCDKTQDFAFEPSTQNAPSTINYQEPEEDYFNEVLAESGLFNNSKPISSIAGKQYDSTPSRHNQNYSPITTHKRQQTTNNVSKKLGEKLLQGWTMLQQSCQDCNVPLMKSKRGEKICCSCEKDYAKEEAQKQKKLSPTITQPNANAQQWKTLQKPLIETKPEPVLQSNQILNTTSQVQGLKSQDLIENIQCKALRFLEFKMDKAIDQNDISAVEKILAIVKGLK